MKVIIQTEHIASNLAVLKTRFQKDIFLVVKNNAYNVGLKKTVETAMENGVRHFMVTDLKSAQTIRLYTKNAYILVMRKLQGDEIEILRELDCATIIPSVEWYETYQENLQGIDLHLKINVGMNRFGIETEDECEKALMIAQANQHQLVGLCTHFPLADEDDLREHDNQVDLFCEIYQYTKRRKHVFSYVHAENSATLMKQDKRLAFCNFSRVGILAYGYSPTIHQPWLKPSVYCEATVIQIKTLKKGQHLGYGTGYVASEDQLIATLDIGYGDGLIRKRVELPAYIQERSYPFAGRISMSHAYLVVDSHVCEGDYVEIFGDYIRVDDMMRNVSGVANSEIMSYLKTERSEYENGK